MPVIPPPWTPPSDGRQANAPESLLRVAVPVRRVMILCRTMAPLRKETHAAAAAARVQTWPRWPRPRWLRPAQFIISDKGSASPYRLLSPRPSHLVFVMLPVCPLSVLRHSSMFRPARPTDWPTWICPRLRRVRDARAILTTEVPRTLRTSLRLTVGAARTDAVLLSRPHSRLVVWVGPIQLQPPWMDQGMRWPPVLLKGMMDIGPMHRGMLKGLTGLTDHAKLLGATGRADSHAITVMPVRKRVGLLGLRRISVVRP